MHDEAGVGGGSDRETGGGPGAHTPGEVDGIETPHAECVGDRCRAPAGAAHDDYLAVAGKLG